MVRALHLALKQGGEFASIFKDAICCARSSRASAISRDRSGEALRIILCSLRRVKSLSHSWMNGGLDLRVWDAIASWGK